MASRTEVQEIVIEPLDALYAPRKDKTKEPKAFARIVEAFFGAFEDVSPEILRAAMDRTAKEFAGPFWPTPAQIRAFMPKVIEGPRNGWTSVPAKWRYDQQMIQLRRLCGNSSHADPLVAIANSLETGIETDPWRTMRNAMALQSMVWENYGDPPDAWPTGPASCIHNARRVVEKYARKAGIELDLHHVPLDQVVMPSPNPSDDWSDEPALK